MATQKVTEAQKRSVDCPNCGAKRGKPCKSSRIPGPNTFGGGWGGAPDLDNSHTERRSAYLAKITAPDAPSCKACGKTLAQCNNEPHCAQTNSYEHDIPGYSMRTVLT